MGRHVNRAAGPAGIRPGVPAGRGLTGGLARQPTGGVAGRAFADPVTVVAGLGRKGCSDGGGDAIV